MARRTSSPDLKLSPQVEWYLQSRGIPLPDCPPAIKTPEPTTLRGARFDPAQVDRVLRAFGQLRHTQGQWAGQPLRPDPWQVAYILAPVFGWVRWDADAGAWVRVITSLYVDVPRKNGKSTLIGGIAVYMACGDGEPGAQVVTAATSERQAGFVFGPIKTLAEKSPALKKHTKPLAKKVIHPRSGSYIEVVSSVADAQHGANIHCGVIDELHVHKTADLVEAIETGTGSRRQPLIAIITTADSGKPGTIYARKRERVEQLARRVLTDPTTYGVVWAADREDDPFAESTWRKANPGFGISPTRAYLAKAATEAQQSPADLAKFLRLHLGIRTKQQTRYVTLRDWDAAAGMVDAAKLAGRACRGGLDLASVEDLTSFALVFPDEHGGMDVLWRHWLPEDRLPDLDKRTAGEASVWVREGFLELTPGNVVDNDRIKARIIADAARFDVQTIGFDRWGASDLVRRLGDEGLTCVGVGQGYASMSAPMKELLRLVKAGMFRHGGNPLMRWQIDNLAVDMDAAGNVKPAKDKSADKIDGVSAVCDALKEHLDSQVEELADADIF